MGRMFKCTKMSLFIFKRWDWNVNAPIRMSHYVGPTPKVVSWHEQYPALGKNNDILSLPHKNLFHNWKHFLVPDGFSVHTITLHGRLCLVQWERISMTLTKGTGFNLTGLGKHLVPDKNTYLDIWDEIKWSSFQVPAMRESMPLFRVRTRGSRESLRNNGYLKSAVSGFIKLQKVAWTLALQH